MSCNDPEPHKPHRYRGHGDTTATSYCEGRAKLREPEGRLYTEEEVAALQQAEVQLILKGLLRNLERVREQRALPLEPGANPKYKAHVRGELWGLDTAIRAVRRRIR